MYKNIILYDGECGLCNRSVQFILKHERNQNLLFSSLQSSFSKKVFSDFNLKNDFDESILFYRDGKLFSKSKARNRKRFSKVCKLPNSNQSNRFLD